MDKKAFYGYEENRIKPVSTKFELNFAVQK